MDLMELKEAQLHLNMVKAVLLVVVRAHRNLLTLVVLTDITVLVLVVFGLFGLVI